MQFPLASPSPCLSPASTPVAQPTVAKSDATRSLAPIESFIVSAEDPERLAQLKAELLRNDPRARITHELPIIHGFSVEVSPESARMLTAPSLVDTGVRVYPDLEMELPEAPPPPTDRPLGLDVATATLGLEKLWKKGIKGEGIGIAFIDSGVAKHPDLKDRIIAFRDIEHDFNRPYDQVGHGTHVASIAAGSGRDSRGVYTGAAPEADIIGVRVVNETGHGNSSLTVAGIQWALDNKDRYHIRVMNLSLGGKIRMPLADDPVVQAVEAVAAAGIVPVVAAGNKGPEAGTITSPANAPSAISVGSFDDRGTPTRADDEVAQKSSRGPTALDGLSKPDLVAPGVKIKAAYRESGYIEDSGTSMASPMVAGCVALMLQVKPDLTPAQVKAALMQTAHPLPGQDPNAQGAGVLDPVAAIKQLTGQAFFSEPIAASTEAAASA